MSNTSRLAQQLPPDQSAAIDAPARPKVMRRPSHFSSLPTVLADASGVKKEETLPDDAPLLSSAQAALPVVLPNGTAWQDDVRFGTILIAIVIAINLALMLWLPHLRASAPATLPTQRETATLPETTSDPSSQKITLYSKPADAAEEDSSDPAPPSNSPTVHILGETPAGSH